MYSRLLYYIIIMLISDIKFININTNNKITIKKNISIGIYLNT